MAAQKADQNSNFQAQANKKVHTFEEMTNGSALSEKKLPLVGYLMSRCSSNATALIHFFLALLSFSCLLNTFQFLKDFSKVVKR